MMMSAVSIAWVSRTPGQSAEGWCLFLFIPNPFAGAEVTGIGQRGQRHQPDKKKQLSGLYKPPP
jgi:hypothetical protein